MWIVGALIGAFVGAAIGHGLWALGAVIGGIVGLWLNQRQPKPAPEATIHERLRHVENEVAALREEVAALRAGRAPEAADVASEAMPLPATAAAPAATDKDDWNLVVVPAVDEKPAAPEAVEELPVAPPPEPFRSPVEMPEWLAKIWAGNPLAKIGIILLFFGVASGLKLAAEYGLMPVPLRLFVAAAAGVALIVFGVAKVRDETHRTFGLAIQGGGFALLYLVGYFMLERYAMIGQGPAFGLFAVLGVACVFLAAKQDGPALAVLGLSGAFLAPVLAGGRADSPLPLFSYFALLNVFILVVDWFKSWRVLNIAGFFFTLAVGMAWAIDGYEERHYLVTQIFVVIFLVAYSAMPAATALLRAPGLAGWRDGMLLFGTPLIGAFLQARLMEGTEYGLAWSALIGSLWYFALWALMFRRSEPEIRIVERSHLGIAIALLTVSVPLAFGAQVTSAFWAAEGTAVLWFGVHTRRKLAQGTGLAMQFAAGVALLLGWHNLGHRLPVTNDAVLGALILTFAGLVAARLLRSLEADPTDRKDNRVPPALPFVWSMLWWLGAGLGEIERFAAHSLHAPYGLLYVAATVIGLEELARLWSWPQVRTAAILLLAGMWVAAAMTIDRAGHPLAGFMALALPLAFVLHYLLLAAHERTGTASLQTVRHLGAWWLLLVVLPAELSWQAQQLAPGVKLWPFMAWALTLAAGIALPGLGVRRGIWPFAADQGGYVPIGIAPPTLGLVILLAWANLHLAGASGLGMPYVPVLNFFDATQLAGIGALLLLSRAVDEQLRPALRALAAALAFLWLSALAGRIAHHWGGVPFDMHALMRSTLFQAILTIFWTVTAIGTMIHASRRSLRELWFGGFGLLGIVGAKLLLFDATGRGTVTWTATLIGVALLVLAASYFAPLPPKDVRDAAP
ncbi:DUF2339 domain-containing protein [Sulfurisoma sediminicola]|uniref:Putative membrane protein n=1 Tax=Sulfurisoma sediminicola TaxID=1381557 RepID=A0A497X977_9PROT|nr:DUF2339 domain-containing protein [Sulfurisoma sediminicola]RLJ62673.1 putative membrane protein [Sulfurisoma sediminicola]